MGRPRKQNKKFDKLFKIKGIKGSYYSSTITADYNTDKIKSAIPTFNNDQIYFTPSFIIPCLYSGNTADYNQQHKKKIFNHQQISRENILVPKPKSKHRICSVCRQQWEDYKTHIESTHHKEKLRKNAYYSHIMELVQKYKKIHKAEKMKKQALKKELEKEDRSEKQFESTVQQQKLLKDNSLRI